MKKFIYESWLTEMVDLNIFNPEPNQVDSIVIEAESFDDALKQVRSGKLQSIESVNGVPKE